MASTTCPGIVFGISVLVPVIFTILLCTIQRLESRQNELLSRDYTAEQDSMSPLLTDFRDGI